MPIVDGSPVNAANTNTQKYDRISDDTAFGIMTLANADPASGPSLVNVQRGVNRLFEATGVDNTTSDGMQYFGAPANTILVGDDHETALSKLAQKFAGITGHNHDGTDGQGPIISSSGGGGGSLSRSVSGSYGSPLQILPNGIGALSTESDLVLYISGVSGYVGNYPDFSLTGSIYVTGIPPVGAGQIDGQILYLVGTSDELTVIFPRSNLFRINGDTRELGADDTLQIMWDANITGYREIGWTQL